MAARSALRRFLSPVPTIARNWFDNPIQSIPVEKLGEFSPSADGACRVRFGGDRVGFVKPREDRGTLVVAHEKIASDLGYVLNLPIAPVVIRLPEEGSDWDRHTAMSLSCLGAARHWAEGSPQVDEKNVESLEALRVFWTWIGDTDHNGHGQNLLYEIDNAGDMQLVAIDHSYIFGQGGEPLTSPICSGYASANHAEAPAIRRATVEQIENFDVAILQRLLHRLVGTVLTESQATEMQGWLESRRDCLRTILKMGGDND